MIFYDIRFNREEKDTVIALYSAADVALISCRDQLVLRYQVSDTQTWWRHGVSGCHEGEKTHSPASITKTIKFLSFR